MSRFSVICSEDCHREDVDLCDGCADIYDNETGKTLIIANDIFCWDMQGEDATDLARILNMMWYNLTNGKKP